MQNKRKFGAVSIAVHLQNTTNQLQDTVKEVFNKFKGGSYGKGLEEHSLVHRMILSWASWPLIMQAFPPESSTNSCSSTKHYNLAAGYSEGSHQKIQSWLILERTKDFPVVQLMILSRRAVQKQNNPSHRCRKSD